jgi:hypothetical protein
MSKLKYGIAMPETKRPLKVFLCHAQAVSISVGALYLRLTKEGVCDGSFLVGGWETTCSERLDRRAIINLKI